MLNKFVTICDLILKPIKKHICFFVFMYILGLICIISVPKINKSIAFCELFFDDYALCLLFTVLPSIIAKPLKFLVYFILYVLAIIDTYCINRLDSAISPTLIQVTLQTNTSEASEALNSYISPQYIVPWTLMVLLLLLFNIVVLIILNRKKKKSGSLHNSISLRNFFSENTLSHINHIITVIVCASLLVSAAKDYAPKKFMILVLTADRTSFLRIHEGYYDIVSRKTLYIPVYRFFYSLKANSFNDEEINSVKTHTLSVKVDSVSFSSPNIVLIIGESHNRNHSTLYGYNKQVTPFQQKMKENGNLYVFKNVITSYNKTTNSFQNMFSMYHYGDSGYWATYPLFPAIMKKAGYHTVFITNQFVQNINEDVWDHDTGMFLNEPTISKAMFDCRNSRKYKYDEFLLNEYDSLKNFNKSENFIIFHLMGLHMQYKDRYPEKWNRFTVYDYNKRTDLSIKDKSVLAAYDNAALYNDYVLYSIVNLFLDSDAIIIYVPDHGEEIFDGCKTCGRLSTLKPIDLYQQYDIPFWIYVTDEYKRKHTQIVHLIENSLVKPFMTDDIGQMILFLGGVSNKYYKEENNLLSPNFNVKRSRRILNQVNYDSVMQKFNYKLEN